MSAAKICQMSSASLMEYISRLTMDLWEQLIWKECSTYQEYFNGTKDVHGRSKCSSKIKQQTNSSSKLRTKSTRDHKNKHLHLKKKRKFKGVNTSLNIGQWIITMCCRWMSGQRIFTLFPERYRTSAQNNCDPKSAKNKNSRKIPNFIL